MAWSLWKLRTRYGVFPELPCCSGLKNVDSVDNKLIKGWFENRNDLDRKQSDKNYPRRGKGGSMHSIWNALVWTRFNLTKEIDFIGSNKNAP
ncbi:hypothetical protein EVAR_75199_1 [Eumeta japonica]|uniref:Uncharacterized protein n=1 Tax=Eumeta variegata TaxID=151549 RepID=A0A4C1U249_EUMVA|nr:hypothetical protein EVAR_75199_1 [Eumeta japonica]